MAPSAERIRAAIRRGAGRTLCPSEVARALAPDGLDDWRALMPAVRAEAARMQAEGLIAVTQKGLAVPAALAKGPIRLGLP